MVGLKGELKIYPYCESKERFETLDSIFIGNDSYKIEKVRYKGSLVILKLRNIDNREIAEHFRDKDVLMDEQYLEPLPAGTYYIKDILGYAVKDTDRGVVGILKDVKNNGAQNIFIIEKKDGTDFLVPAVEQFFLGVDTEDKIIMVDLIEGMYED